MNVKRLDIKFKADPKKVILQYFAPGSQERIENVIDRISKLNEDEVSALLEDVVVKFKNRHKEFERKLLSNYDKISSGNEKIESFSDKKKLLTGAYFSKEYSVEAAALFNPSVVPHPDQSGVPDGSTRFIMSLRATGEGHISSIEFRSGIADKNGNIKMEDVSAFSETPFTDNNEIFDKEFIVRRLSDNSSSPFDSITGTFSKSEIEDILAASTDTKEKGRFADEIRILSDANYTATFPAESELSERVFFPISKSESVGMEDVRLVRFTEDDGTTKYYGTYTAYNGRSFGTQLLETDDFMKFKIRTLHGKGVNDKGMALFPRKINGKYFITSRQGGENLYIMSSDDLYFWNEYTRLSVPEYPWEFVQLGNCGSPIETDGGWLLITHSVGAFRTYRLGAMLLDIDNPSKVIGTLTEPLLEPNSDEREGYVPNVVYSCGSMRNDDTLIIPYAMSDSASGFIKVSIKELLKEITQKG